MPTGNPVRLLTLADREFRQLTGKPVAIEPARKFKPMKLNAARFDSSWDRKRGATQGYRSALQGPGMAARRAGCGAYRRRFERPSHPHRNRSQRDSLRRYSEGPAS